MTDELTTFDAVVAHRKEKNPEAFAFGSAMADKSVALWQILTSMVHQSNLTNAEIARRMRTSPAAVSRMLNPDNAGSISARTLFKLEYATNQFAFRYLEECENCRERERQHGFADGAVAFDWKVTTDSSRPDIDLARIFEVQAQMPARWEKKAG